MAVAKERKLVVLGDFNEAMGWEEESLDLTHRAARGGLITQGWVLPPLQSPPSAQKTGLRAGERTAVYRRMRSACAQTRGGQ